MSNKEEKYVDGAFILQKDLPKVLRLTKYGFDLKVTPQEDGRFYVEVSKIQGDQK